MAIYQMRDKHSFSRTDANIEKMGAYYTDVAHCRDIGKFLIFPEGEEVCCLEPSIGDGSAIEAVTGAATNENIRIFGCELNHVVAEETAKKSTMEKVLSADFLCDVQISNGVFTFCFGNPPYMMDSDGTDDKERMERKFLEKVTNYLKVGGLLVWVIPYRIFAEREYLRFLATRYELLNVFRFRDAEYNDATVTKHQVAIIARRTAGCRCILKDTMDEICARYDSADKIPVLPEDGEPSYEVLPSGKENIRLFTTKAFNYQACYDMLDKGTPKDIKEYIEGKLSVNYEETTVSSPPIPLKKDHLYLVATCGGGEGLVGSEEAGDLHIAGGHVETVEDVEVQEDGKGGTIQVVTEHSAVSMIIIENSGKISHLA